MITLYSGTPGSGKSLHMAKLLVEGWASNRPMCGNFPVNAENLCKGSILKKKNTFGYYYLDNYSINPRILCEYAESVFQKIKYKENKILLIIDECQLLFNSRDFQRKDRMEWLTFFTQHRKFGFEIILVSQYDRMIDRQIRCLIENEVNHRQIASFGTFGKLSCLFGGKNVFTCIHSYYPLKERLSVSFFVKKKKYYSVYDTNYKFIYVDDVKISRNGVLILADQERPQGIKGSLAARMVCQCKAFSEFLNNYSLDTDKILYLQRSVYYGR